jgi:transcriptional regulator with XRE-family HTH domain
MHDIFMYKNVYVPSGINRLLDGYAWCDLVYYKHEQLVNTKGDVIDRWVKAPVDKISYVKGLTEKKSYVPMLKNVLVIRDMTLGDLSKGTGIKVQSLKEYIDGDTKPRYETIEKLSNYLDVPMATLQGLDYIGLEMDIVNKHDAMVEQKRKEEAERARYVMESFWDYIKHKDFTDQEEL